MPPVSPEKLGHVKSPIPEFLFEVVNSMLSRRLTIYQKDVVEAILALRPKVAVDAKEIFERHWLDFESAYEREGWDVWYDKPGYNESYDPSWHFSPKDK